MNAITQTVATPDFGAIKAKQNAAWSSGDYGRIGATLQLTGEELAEALDLPCGAKVLDVAAGNGNITLAMARRWCEVTSTDYVGALLAQSRARAEAEHLPVTYSIADAENLPFKQAEFDAVVSTFGVMFTPNQEQSASELLRVCRTGGKIGLANWTPEGFIGQLFKTLGQHIAPPAGVKSPAMWGSRSWFDDTFGKDADVEAFTQKSFMFRYRSPEHFLDFFRVYYGPIHMAFLALDEAGQAALHSDITSLIERFNIATDGSMRVPSEYAEIVLVRK
jgi:ubiquinone/menaquinone biosynthesis C-methylase UbiE